MRRTPQKHTVIHKLEQFTEYVDQIDELARPRGPVNRAEWRKRLALCLNGEPNRVLREQVPQADLRCQGAYFTGPKLAGRLARLTIATQMSMSTYYDPACGAGDLLLAIAQKLPIRNTFEDTLVAWGACLSGCDISADFVRLAKARLILLAAKRANVRPPFDSPALSDAFAGIVVADSLSASRPTPTADAILMNPPFGYATAPVDCHWAKGRVNVAAIFIDRAIRDAADGTFIAAILPDVLRSGSRYTAWREMTHASGYVIGETRFGLFDPWTDVDVYLFQFKKKTIADGITDSPRPTSRPTFGIGKRFCVHVGPVVPHRDKEKGPIVPYIHARSLPPWCESADIAEERRFSGRLFKPPFVTVRRTSRPDSGNRAVSTLILGPDPIAVENHLIVLIPKDGEVKTCRLLMQRLRSPRSDNWLNARLRCRHLTTCALAEMPWWRKP